MFYWVIYLLSSFIICFVLSRFIRNKKIRLIIFILSFTVLATPALINTNSSELAPAIAIFFFDLIFENIFSTRSLRVLSISVPSTLLLLLLVVLFRRKLF